MAEDWKDMYEFTGLEILLAKYFEDMRQNLQHLKEPRFAVTYGKLPLQDITVATASNIAWSPISTTYLDPITINTSGRDVIITSNPSGWGTTSTTANWTFGLRIDGTTLVYGDGTATGGMATIIGARTRAITVPVFGIVSGLSIGDHTIELMHMFGQGTGGNGVLRISPRLFLAALEL